MVETVIKHASKKFALDMPDRRLRRRHDLMFQQTGTGRWNVLDPITRQSYRIGLVEHWLLTRADGKLPVPALIGQLRHEMPSVLLSDEQLFNLVRVFHRNGLMWTKSMACESSSRAGSLESWLGSVVVWQIRGIQPDAWLARLAPHTDLLFSFKSVQLWLGMIAFTLALVLLEFNRLCEQTTSLGWILQPAAGGMLFLVFIATRAVHELGHALVCKRFGVRCPDIGLFLILGAPCVYCDVSESWQLPGRWQRAAVAAAGMYVELVVACLAAWVWLSTVDGAANTLALQTMLVCSVSTLVINANPLMRFDGYHILADWFDEVNLRGKADAVAWSGLRWLVLGIPVDIGERASGRRFLLQAFSLAGWGYRAVLSIAIATVLISIYGSWNLPWIGRFLGAAILVSWWVVPMVKAMSDLYRLATQTGRRWRLAICSGLLVPVIGLLPLPSRTTTSGWLQPSRFRGVYAGTEATLVACSASDGQLVIAGEQLFQLHNSDVSMRLVRCQQAKKTAEIRLDANRRRLEMHGQDIEVQHYVTALEQATSWQAGAQEALEQLKVCSPMSGRLLAMPADSPASIHAESQPVHEGSLPVHWCESQQLGRLVPSGQLLASVCSEERIAVLPLTEQQLSGIAVGCKVRLCLDASHSVLAKCQVESIVQLDELASPWQTAPDVASAAAELPTSARFAAVVKVPSHLPTRPGTTVQAVFVSASTTMAATAARWLKANLRPFAD